MILRRLELVRVDLPLVRPFRSAGGTQTVRPVLLVHVESDAGEGWGEAAAQAEPTYNEEFVDGSALVIERFCAPILAGAGALSPEGVVPALGRIKGYPAAKAGLEMAVLDAELRAGRVRLADYLGGVRPRVEVGVSVGMAPSPAALVEDVASYLGAGYRRVKLKIEPGFDLGPVAAVRSAFPDLALQVDANGSYRPGHTETLRELDKFGLLMVEQPFAADELAAHADLARTMATPICLDETVTSLSMARAALDSGACSVVNIKPARVGGLLAAKAIHDLCVARAVPVWCGGMLESGVGRAANVALAALPGFSYPGDISASDRYFQVDLTEPFVLQGSELAVPSGPGIGVTVDPAVLARLGALRWDLPVRP